MSNTYFTFNTSSPAPPPKGNRAVYDIVWEKKYGTAGQATANIIRRMRIACWVTKDTDKHSEYVLIPIQVFIHNQHKICKQIS
jgi:hypothetical protein